MRAFLVLYVRDFEGDNDRCLHKFGKCRSSERRAFTLLSTVCWHWHQTLIGWPQSATGHWLRNQLKKLIEREYMHTLVVLVHIIGLHNNSQAPSHRSHLTMHRTIGLTD